MAEKKDKEMDLSSGGGGKTGEENVMNYIRECFYKTPQIILEARVLLKRSQNPKINKWVRRRSCCCFKLLIEKKKTNLKNSFT